MSLECRTLLLASVRLSTDYTQIYGILNEIKNNIFFSPHPAPFTSRLLSHKKQQGVELKCRMRVKGAQQY